VRQCAWQINAGEKYAVSGASRAAERALALDPKSDEGHIAPGKLLYFRDWDWAGANEEFRRGRALDPRDSYANYFSGEIASTLGRSDEALDFYRHAIDQDPLNIKSSSPPGRRRLLRRA
jgi:tetratricopeptide (TPR) repeat protein